MASPKQKPSDKEPRAPTASVTSMDERDDAFEMTVRVQNPLDRAIHYIADVRAITFDPATRTVRVRLSEQGLEMPPGGMMVLPRIRRVDPQSEAAMNVRLPKTIVKLAATQTPGTEVTFEEHAIADAEEIALDIGWSETPFYADPRESSQLRSPVSTWEQATIRTVFAPPSRRRERK